jgi:hypothetical protein
MELIYGWDSSILPIARIVLDMVKSFGIFSSSVVFLDNDMSSEFFSMSCEHI